jgi:hypothetical protein
MGLDGHALPVFRGSEIRLVWSLKDGRSLSAVCLCSEETKNLCLTAARASNGTLCHPKSYLSWPGADGKERSRLKACFRMNFH